MPKLISSPHSPINQPTSATNTDQPNLRTPDFVNENFAKLAALFPHRPTAPPAANPIGFGLLPQELAPAVAAAPQRAPTSQAPASTKPAPPLAHRHGRTFSMQGLSNARSACLSYRCAARWSTAEARIGPLAGTLRLALRRGVYPVE
jgi:hypothetical protein